MDALVTSFAEIPADNPIPLLTRQKVEGEQMLVAKVHLAKGCHVAPHRHVSEQIAMVQNGLVRWTIDEGDRQRIVEVSGGGVVVVPSNVLHSVDALEDTDILDVLSPKGPMGVDSQVSS